MSDDITKEIPSISSISFTTSRESLANGTFALGKTFVYSMNAVLYKMRVTKVDDSDAEHIKITAVYDSDMTPISIKPRFT